MAVVPSVGAAYRRSLIDQRSDRQPVSSVMVQHPRQCVHRRTPRAGAAATSVARSGSAGLPAAAIRALISRSV